MANGLIGCTLSFVFLFYSNKFKVMHTLHCIQQIVLVLVLCGAKTTNRTGVYLPEVTHLLSMWRHAEPSSLAPHTCFMLQSSTVHIKSLLGSLHRSCLVVGAWLLGSFNWLHNNFLAHLNSSKVLAILLPCYGNHSGKQ